MKNTEKNDNAIVLRRKGRPSLLDDEFFVKVKDVVTGVRMAGGIISRKMVTTIGTGVSRANCPSKLKDFEGHIALTEGWAIGVLKSMEWSKKKDTTDKTGPSKQFLLEEKLTFQRHIVSIIEEHDIPKELILNLNQTPLSYVSPGKYTINPKGVKTVPIKGINDKRQITATVTVSMTGKFLPIQFIYERKTPRCLPRFDFPADFNVTFSDNHWSNIEKSIELFEKVIFPNLKQAKASLKYPKEQMSLIIMDTFKGQYNDVILDQKAYVLLSLVVIVSHNLTNKFQLLDFTVNKPAKSFISNKYNEWFSKQVSQQLEKGIQPADVKLSLGLNELKVMHAKRILELYNHLCHQNEIILNGCKAANITEAVESANAMLERIENPFSEQ